MTMIEKVARAIFKAEYPDAVNCDSMSADWLKLAKAAIEAMREPSDKMVLALIGFDCSKEHPLWNLTAEGYQEAIDAALKE